MNHPYNRTYPGHQQPFQPGARFRPVIPPRRKKMQARYSLEAGALDKPNTPFQMGLEAGLYFFLFLSAFDQFLGWRLPQFSQGGFLLALGGLALLVQVISKEKMPVSPIFFIVVMLSANFSLVVGLGVTPGLGAGLNDMLHTANLTLVFCYLIRYQNVERRMMIFMALLLLFSIYTGKTEEALKVSVHHQQVYRLALEGVGVNFQNSNHLAYFAASLTSIFLFFSFLNPSKRALLINWIFVPPLIIAALQTLSRSGALSLALGIVIFVFASFRTSHRFAILIVGVVTLATLYMSSEYIDNILVRFGDDSGASRIAVYSSDLVTDLMRTFLWGRGHDDSITFAGITAHNSFIHTWIAFGGVTGLIYLCWMAFMGFSVLNTFRSPRVTWPVKWMLVAVFGMMIVSHAFTNLGYVILTSVFSVAIIEKYTYGFQPTFLKKGRA